MITFLVTVMTILGLLHWFLYARLVSALGTHITGAYFGPCGCWPSFSPSLT